MTAITPVKDQLPEVLAKPKRALVEANISDDAKRYIAAANLALRANTLTAYSNDVGLYLTYCREISREPFDAAGETAQLWLGYMLGQEYKLKTIKRRVSSLRKAYKHQVKGGWPDEAELMINSVVRGARNEPERFEKGLNTTRKVKPINGDDLQALFAMDLPDFDENTVVGLRNKTILVLAYVAALRRSEVASLKRRAVAIERDEVSLTFWNDKGSKARRADDQSLVLTFKSESLQLARLMEEWFAVLDHQGRSGPQAMVFYRIAKGQRKAKGDEPAVSKGNLLNEPMTGWMVYEIVLRAAKALGRDPSEFGGHSLRRGHITKSLRKGHLQGDVMASVRIGDQATLMEYLEVSDEHGKNRAPSLD